MPVYQMSRIMRKKDLSAYRLTCWVKFNRRHFDFFFLKTGFDISCKVSPGDNLHELSKPILWENKKKKYFKVSSAEFA